MKERQDRRNGRIRVRKERRKNEEEEEKKIIRKL